MYVSCGSSGGSQRRSLPFRISSYTPANIGPDTLFRSIRNAIKQWKHENKLNLYQSYMRKYSGQNNAHHSHQWELKQTQFPDIAKGERQKVNLYYKGFLSQTLTIHILQTTGSKNKTSQARICTKPNYLTLLTSMFFLFHQQFLLNSSSLSTNRKQTVCTTDRTPTALSIHKVKMHIFVFR